MDNSGRERRSGDGGAYQAGIEVPLGTSGTRPGSRLKSDFNRVIHSVNNLSPQVMWQELPPGGARESRRPPLSARYPQLWISCGYWPVVKWITLSLGAEPGKARVTERPGPASEKQVQRVETYPQEIHTVNNSHACNSVPNACRQGSLRATACGKRG